MSEIHCKKKIFWFFRQNLRLKFLFLCDNSNIWKICRLNVVFAVVANFLLIVGMTPKIAAQMVLNQLIYWKSVHCIKAPKHKQFPSYSFENASFLSYKTLFTKLYKGQYVPEFTACILIAARRSIGIFAPFARGRQSPLYEHQNMKTQILPFLGT